ncbi:hypothetical protein [Mycetocola saprophilus]|uniref:hypothetical protein n=1 Tax=Mycetocola saprophilus TaxID=76636 RepID=UPI003BF38FEB
MGRIEFPEVEAMLATFLTGRVEGQVEGFVPATIPDRFTRVVRIGGVADNRALETARVSWTAWGTSKADAAVAAQRVRSVLLNDFMEMSLVRGLTEISGPYFDPDPDTGRARYSGTVELRVRARRI